MKKKIICLCLALVLAAGLFAGCTSSPASDPTDNQGQTDNGGTNATPNTDVDESKKYGGEYKGHYNFTAFNFFSPEQGTKGANIYMSPAIESLGRFNAEGEIEWLLLESVETDPDTGNITMKIREGITFSDGSTFNAEVLGWNIDMYVEYGRQSMVANCFDWEVEDEYTITLKWDTGYDSCRMDILAIIRVVSKEAYETHGYDYMVQTPVGTGAFVLDEAVESSYVSYVKRDDYWQEGLPYLDKITYYAITDENTLISSFLNGEISEVTTGNGTTQATVDQLEAAGFKNKSNTENAALVSMNFLQTTDGNPDSPWYDENVRRAAYYAIDIESLVPGLYGTSKNPARQMAVPGMWHYLEEDEMTYVYSYDVDKAKEYLAQSGYPNGFSTTFVTTNTHQNAAVAIKSYLDAIGIQTEIRLLDSTAYLQQVRNEMWDGITISGGAPSSLNPTDWFGRNFDKEGTRTLLKVAGGYFDSVIDALALCRSAYTPEEQEAGGKAFGIALNETLTGMAFTDEYSMVYTQDNVFDTGSKVGAPYQNTPEIMYILQD